MNNTVEINGKTYIVEFMKETDLEEGENYE